jgi:TRAP transporter 4TM/12TM fusion protein
MNADTPAVPTGDRYDHLPAVLRYSLLVLIALGLVFVTVYTLGIQIPGLFLNNVHYYFIIFGVFGSISFLILPERKLKTRWFDYLFAVVFAALCAWFAINGDEIAFIGWLPADPFEIACGTLFIVLSLEACRRVAGISLPLIALLFGLFPLVADRAPGVFQGIQYDYEYVISFYAFSSNGVLGVPAQTLGGIMIGFLIFAGLLLATGAGKFFLDMAYSLLGRYRGGPAKVGIFSSALFGSITGGPVTTVVATGPIFMKDMIKLGYPPYYAGALAAVASTGGALSPPVMGIAAFVMANLLNIPYAEVAVAAIIPTVLFYYGLVMQADLYAAKSGMKGLPASEIPKFRTVLAEGWHFLLILAFLVFGLVYMRWEALTPFYSIVLLVLLSMFRKETRLTIAKIRKAIYEIGKLIAMTTAIILPVGVLVCAITVTGVGASFTAGVINLGGQNIILILLIGVAACYVMGMAGILIAAYVFLGVTLAPILVLAGGLNEVAVHLFIMYWAILSLITPPVAGCSFVSAAVAGAPPMKTAFASMKLGIVLYFIPFFFVMHPALVLRGTAWQTIYMTALCLVGISFIAMALEGYIYRFGRIRWPERILLGIGGFLIAEPGVWTALAGFAIVMVGIGWIALTRRKPPLAAA